MVYCEDPLGNIFELFVLSYEFTFSAGAYQNKLSVIKTIPALRQGHLQAYYKTVLIIIYHARI